MRYLVLLGGLAAAILGYWLFWDYLAARLLAGAEQWAGEQRAAGLILAHRPFTVEGFPYRLTLRADGFSLADLRGAERWTVAGNVLAHLQPWSPNHAVVQGGDMTVTAWRSGDAPPAVARPFNGRASIVSEAGQWQRLGLDAERPALATTGLVLSAERLKVAVRRNRGADKDHPEGSFDLNLDAEGVDVPAAVAPGFDRVIGRINASGLLTGQWSGGPLAAALEAWREDGGILDVARFELVWGKVEARGNATLALDKPMRPEGAGTADIKGFTEIIDTLVKSGQMRAADGGFAKAGLALMAKPDSDGRPVLKLPISAQGGQLFLGPAPVAKLQPILK